MLPMKSFCIITPNRSFTPSWMAASQIPSRTPRTFTERVRDCRTNVDFPGSFSGVQCSVPYICLYPESTRALHVRLHHARRGRLLRGEVLASAPPVVGVRQGGFGVSFNGRLLRSDSRTTERCPDQCRNSSEGATDDRRAPKPVVKMPP